MSTVWTLLEEQLPCAGPDIAGWFRVTRIWKTRLKQAQESPESEAILFLPAEGQRGLFKASNAEEIYQGLFAICCDSQSLPKTAKVF